MHCSTLFISLDLTYKENSTQASVFHNIICTRITSYQNSLRVSLSKPFRAKKINIKMEMKNKNKKRNFSY